MLTRRDWLISVRMQYKDEKKGNATSLGWFKRGWRICCGEKLVGGDSTAGRVRLEIIGSISISRKGKEKPGRCSPKKIS